MKQAATTRWMIGSAKIAAAMCIVAAIGWWVVSHDTSGDVPEARADIFDLSALGGKPHVIGDFEKALEHLGHDEAQVYELNGNTIFFSVRHFHNAAPSALLRRYQDTFVATGVNDRAYYHLGRHDNEARLFTALKGGVVPQTITKDHITMGGMLMKSLPETDVEVVRSMEPGQNEAEAFRGHRWVEVMREKGTSRTTVIASWSDDDFDYEKMLPGSDVLTDSQKDADVPTCPSCVRVNHFEETARKDAIHETQVFVGGQPLRQLRPFYVREMESRGWDLLDSSSVMQRVRGEIDVPADHDTMVFSRDDEEMTILLYETLPGETAVHATRSPARPIDPEDD